MKTIARTTAIKNTQALIFLLLTTTPFIVLGVAPGYANTNTATPLIPDANAIEWDIVTANDGITTSLASIENLPIKLVKHQARIVLNDDNGHQKLIEAYGDGKGCPEWLGLCKKSEVVAKHDDGSETLYVVINMPWPLSDRDSVVLKRLIQDEKKLVIHTISTPGAVPPSKLTRMVSESRMTAEYLKEKGIYQVSWEVYSDPQGSIPSGTVNRRSHQESRADFIKLVTQLKSS